MFIVQGRHPIVEKNVNQNSEFSFIPNDCNLDDKKNITLLSSSSVEKDIRSEQKTTKTELSKIVAEKLAKKAKEKNIIKIYFDRGLYKYHGRVKVFAETLRKNGMEF